MQKHLPIYTLLGAAATVYTCLLNTRTGRRLTDEQTWLTVSVGTALVLGALRFVLPEREWNQSAAAFVVAGAPLIARSVVNQLSE